MPCIVAGVEWVIAGDFGSLGFVLNRDELNRDASVLTPRAEALEDITDMVLGATWRWGPTTALGPMTEAAAGRATISLIDTTRLFDPLNAESPMNPYLALGLPVRITADGLPAFTGSLADWSHDLGPSESVLEVIDPVGAAGQEPADELALPASSTAGQAEALAAAAGWSGRFRVEGVPRFDRLAVVAGAAALLEQLAPVRRAELGELYATRAGELVLRVGDPPAPATSLVVNCGGVPLTALATKLGLGRVRNVVRIRDHDPETFTASVSIARNRRREIATSVGELALDDLSPV